jgi:predicted ATPase
MLTGVLIKNYKSIEDSGLIELKPLTIFTGPNSSGKSNILESLAILAQTTRLGTERQHTLTASLEAGEFVRYPHPCVEYVTYKKDVDRCILFEVYISTAKATISQGAVGYGHSYRPSTGEATSYIIDQEAKLFEVAYEKTGESTYKKQVKIPERFKGYDVKGSPICLFDPESFSIIIPASEIRETDGDISENAGLLIRNIANCLRQAYFITALRGGIEAQVRIGLPPGVGRETPSWVGTRGEHLVEILALCFGKREYYLKAEKIDEWSERLGVGKISAGWVGGNRLGGDFEDPILKTSLNLVLASSGSRQILSMITQLFWSEPGDVIMIEEPEISLHPQSQILVQDLFATAVKDGKQIICSTHSPFLILALSKVIKSGKLSQNDVVVYHVEKGKSGTKVKRLELNEHGFVTGYIPSYLKVEDDLFDEWARSLEKE